MNWLIVGGAARSGTSAFLKALNSRPDIFLIPEYYWSHSLDSSIFKKYASSLSKINIGKVNNQERPGSNTLLIKDFIEYIPSQDKCLRSIVEAISYSCSGKTELNYVRKAFRNIGIMSTSKNYLRYLGKSQARAYRKKPYAYACIICEQNCTEQKRGR